MQVILVSALCGITHLTQGAQPSLFILTSLTQTVPGAGASASGASVRHPCRDDMGDEKKDCPSQSMGPGLHVDPSNGNVWTELPILSATSFGEDTLNLTLRYNSWLGLSDVGLGAGWTHSYDMRLFEVDPHCIQYNYPCLPPPVPSDPAQCDDLVHQTLFFPRIILLEGDGTRLSYRDWSYDVTYTHIDHGACPTYVFSPGRVFGAPVGQQGKLTILASNAEQHRYQLEFIDGTVRKYFTNGHIAEITNPRGLKTTFSYDYVGVVGAPNNLDYRLKEVIDPYGRKIKFIYNLPTPEGRLIEIEHPDSTPQNVIKTYLSRTGNLDSVRDPEDKVIHFEYGSSDRLVREVLKNGTAYRAEYIESDYYHLPNNPPPTPAHAILKWLQRKILIEVPGGAQPELYLHLKSTSSFPGLKGYSFRTDDVMMEDIDSTDNGLGINWLQQYPVSDSEGSQFVIRDESGIDWTYARDLYGRIISRSSEYLGYENWDFTGETGELGNPPFPNAGQGGTPPDSRRLNYTIDILGLRRSYTWTLDNELASETVSFPETHEPALITGYTYWNSTNVHRLKTKQLPSGLSYFHDYDVQGNIKLIREYLNDHLNAETNITYLYNGAIVTQRSTIRPDQSLVTEFFNPRGCLTEEHIQVSASETLIKTYDHDYMGRRTSISIPRGDGTFAVTKHSYDKMGRLTKTIEAYVGDGSQQTHEQNLTTEFKYDGHGLLTEVKNPRGHKTGYHYDHRNYLDQIIEDVDDLHLTTYYQRKTNGDLISVTDPEARVTLYDDDSDDNGIPDLDENGYRILLITDALTYVTDRRLDAKGNIVKELRQRNLGDQNLQLVYDASYDEMGRITNLAKMGDEPISYSYNHDGNTGSGCSCTGQGSSTPYRIRKGDPYYQPQTYAEVTYNDLDEYGRIKHRVQKVGLDDNVRLDDQNDAITKYEYDVIGNLHVITDPEGETTILGYDLADRLVRRAIGTVFNNSSEDLITQYNLNGVGNPKTVTLPTGHVLTYEYDKADRVERISDDPFGTIAEYIYDANGNIEFRTDGEGHTWEYSYDSLDRLVEVMDPLGGSFAFATYTYDDVGNLIAKTNKASIKTCYCYDQLNRLLCVTEDCTGTPGQCPEQGSSNKENLDGESEEGVQGKGVILEGEYESEDPATAMLETMTATSDTKTCYEYDGRFMVRMIDHDGNSTQYDTSLGAGATIKLITYPGNAGGVAIIESPGINEIYRLDQASRETTFKFDQLGHLAEKQYGGSNGHTDLFAFDKSGRLKSATGQENSWSREYDLAGRPKSETQIFGTVQSPTSYVTNYEYTLNSTAHQLEQAMCYPGNACATGDRVVHRVYDGRGRLISAVNPGTSETDLGVDWTYDAANRREYSRRRNGNPLNKTAYGYDLLDQVTSIRHNKIDGFIDPPASSLPYFDYGYDQVGNRTFMRKYQDWSDRSELYGYDNRNRLTTMDRGVLTPAGVTPVEMAGWISNTLLASKQQWSNLDRRGNWLEFREMVTGGTRIGRLEKRTPNPVNAYTAIDPDGPDNPLPSVTLQYDAIGNLTFDPLARNLEASAPDGQRFEFDEENRVTKVHRADTDTNPANDPLLMEFKYDALGRRVETISYVAEQSGTRLTNSIRTRHVYAGLETIQELTCGTGATACDGSSWSLAREFIWGDSNRFLEPIVMIKYTSGVATPFHYLHDVLGSVIGLTNAAGDLVERYTYDPYGRTFIESWITNIGGSGGAWSVNTVGPRTYSFYGNPFMWTGQRYDASVGTYHFWARTYSPILGRWLGRDPIGYTDGINLYEFVISNPISFVDPSGLRLRVSGNKNMRERFERMLKKLCPRARVNKKTGDVDLNSDDKADCDKNPSTSKPNDRLNKACQKLKALIDSSTNSLYVISHTTKVIDTEGRYDPDHKNKKNNIRINVSVRGIFTTKDGKTRAANDWEAVWHEIIHGVHDEQNKGAADISHEEINTINEMNELLDEQNQGKPPNEQVPLRDPYSHPAVREAGIRKPSGGG
jgi:RHS repeat-associated protein